MPLKFKQNGLPNGSSAGLLMYRRTPPDRLEVLLVHPGGPFWAKKDLGSWSIPKGKCNDDEAALEAAKREFKEETGFTASGDFFDLGSVKRNSGKPIYAWAFEGDCDPARMVSNSCEVEWPPRSGRMIEIPEVDRGAWFPRQEATERIVASQIPFVERLVEHLERRQTIGA